nr:immunoglobulin heavy chain junction region [Mus musculus]MBK4184397.1 immunoglobulin heavy chain junction region [Mus musculus]MBK4184398.1 immunoglobulin heavy chain junction region [Mus musculus]MBK4184400.1 immunoglobulin heavy chain junction region [Mus musculus]MBK4184401.1 immunoglobulin heavy chain junction region [Mus musculus]
CARSPYYSNYAMDYW